MTNLTTREMSPLERDIKGYENDYDLVVLEANTKAPSEPDWQIKDVTLATIKAWAKSPKYANGNRGILTKHTPAIDLDISDKAVLAEILQYAMDKLGIAPIRVGREPRCLLMYRTDTPFRKMKTGKFKDEWNEEHEVEILGDGQQFVAFGIHPVTLKPFRWTSEQSPINTKVSELSLITAEQCRDLINFAISVFEKAGFKRTTNAVSGKAYSVTDKATPEADDWALTVQPNFDETPANISKVKSALSYITSSCSYDEWRDILFALKSTQWNCARDIAIAWSIESDKFDLKAFNNLWESAKVTR